MDIRIIDRIYNDGMRPRSIVPELWMIDSDGNITSGVTGVNEAGRVAIPIHHEKNGKWSNTDWELHGKSGDMFVSVQREFEGGIFPTAHSMAEAQGLFEEAIGRKVSAETFRVAMEEKFSSRVVVLDELERRLAALA